MITGPGETVKRARKLRQELTPPERLMWLEMRKRPAGLKFRNQHPAGVYVLDFYCAAAKLAIQIDRFAHENADVMRKDSARSQGVATLRVPARAVLDDLHAAVERIVEVCEGRIAQRRVTLLVPLHHPADGPPPRFGED